MSPPIKKNLELDSTLMMICSPSGNLRLEGFIAHIADKVWAIKDLHPLGFTLDDLNNELHSMMLICALPEEYSSFVSSLMLIDDLNCSTIHAVFRNEQLDRECHPGIPTDTSTVAALATISNSTNTPCDFCGYRGHTLLQCGKYAVAKTEVWKSK